MKSKFFMGLFSLAIAFTLWLYVITVVSPNFSQEYQNVPVGLSGESVLSEKGLMLISESIPTAKVILNGNRSDLAEINRENLTLVADLSKISEAGVHKLTYTVTPPGSMSVSVEDRDPKTITVEVVERLTAKVPVEVSYTGTLPENYIMDKGRETLSVSEVTVSGPRDVVEQIKQAVIEINCDGRTETVVEDLRYKLCDENGEPLDVSMVTTDVEQIHLEIRVSRVKTIPLKLTVNPGGGATEENSSIVIEPKEITISGNDIALEGLEELVMGSINLGSITAAESREFDINSVLPEGIRNESGIQTAVAEISFPDLTKKDFTITNIRTVNVAEGMEATLVTKQLTITVRGPKEQVLNLTNKDINAVLDLTDVVNTDTLVPEITFAEKFPDLGVLGKPTVTVTVAEPVPETEPSEPTEE